MKKIAFLLNLFLSVVVFNVNAQVTGNAVNNLVLKGSIIDKNGKPVPFASLNIKNKSTGFIADSLGQIEISLPPNTIVVIGSVGY